MKLRDLTPGDFFQFRRQGHPAIYVVLDPAAGRFMRVGQYQAGEPSPICHLHPDGPCPEAEIAISPQLGCKREEKDRPDRAVAKQRIRVLRRPTGYHDFERIYSGTESSV